MTLTHAIAISAGGIAATIFLPQLIKTLKTGECGGVSLLTVGFAAMSSGLWMLYGILLPDAAIIYISAISFLTTAALVYLKFRFRKKASDMEL